MARQVLPIVGAFVGAYFGNPQLGYAIGSIIGNAVDPLRVKGPTLKEIPSQTAGEGSFRQVVYGTSIIRDTNIVDFGEVERVKTETQQGKGGGPIVEGERLLRTYAIGLGEPFAAVRWIRRNGVVVYDIRPGSTILAESAAFAQRFRFYDGSETQLPDPDLEALPHNGVGNTPAYRGTAYMVFPRDDLTDLQGQIPTYEVEAVQDPSVVYNGPSLVTEDGFYSGAPDSLSFIGGITWAGSVSIAAASKTGTYISGSVPASTAANRFEIQKYDEETDAFVSLSPPADYPVQGPAGMIWSPDGNYLLITGTEMSNENWIVYERDGDTFTKLPDPAVWLNAGATGAAWDFTGQRFVVSNANTGDVCGVYDFTGGSIGDVRSGLNLGGEQADSFSFRPFASDKYLAIRTATRVVIVDTSTSPLVEVASHTFGVSGLRPIWQNGGQYLVCFNSTGPDYIRVLEFDSTPGAEALVPVFPSIDQPGWQSISVSQTGNFIATARNYVSQIYPPYIFEMSDASPPTVTMLPAVDDTGSTLNTVSWSLVALETIEGAPTTLRAIIEDICDRCGIPAGKLDMTALTDEVDGITLGGQYGGAGAITTLMPAYFFDLFEADKKLVAVKRGGAVKATITVDDLVEEPDENSLRGQDTEYPRQLMVKYLNPGQNYAAPAAVVSRKTPDIRVRGEVTLDLPISLTETPALQIADKILKVMWEDLNGEATFTLPLGPFAWLTPSDCLGYVARSGSVYRLRVEKVNDAAREITITARRDRQSAYTSNLTAIPLPAPPPPPPSLPGITQVALLNIPGIIDSDDQLGFRIGVCGQQGSAWYGAQVAYSTDGGLTYTSLGNITTRAVMGRLIAPLAAASEFYPDRTNSIEVQLEDTDELEAVTEAQWLSEGNPAAIVRSDYTAELVQFKDVADLGDKEWSLTTLQRGRLATSAAAHGTGERFVMLDSTVFLPLPTSAIGQSLKIRVTSLGTTPETAPVFDFLFSPAYCQREFPPADLSLTTDGTTITASWSPRHRFGTEDAPVASANLLGYRVEASDGVTTKVTDPVAGTTHLISEAPFAGDVTVTVYPINRFTGLGPPISGTISI